VAARLGLPKETLPVLNLEWLGLFTGRRLSTARISPLDALGELMFEKLAFQPGERDMVALHHDFRIEFPEGRCERVVSELIDFGIPGGDSSMSRTVALPAAVGVDLILTGRIQARGVLRPITREMYDPVLSELEGLGIACREKTEYF